MGVYEKGGTLIGILLFRVLYWGPLFLETPIWLPNTTLWGTGALGRLVAAARGSAERFGASLLCRRALLCAKNQSEFMKKIDVSHLGGLLEYGFDHYQRPVLSENQKSSINL